LNYQYFPKNAKGRDFICADVHGYFDILDKLLDEHHFEPTVDRLFSLGDLIDRGDDSALFIHWLAKPWFHAIQGNHERMLIDVFESQSEQIRLQWERWGGQWAKGINDSIIADYYHAIMQLPAAMEIEINNAESIGLIHAELPDQCDWLDVKQKLLKAPKNIEDDPIISNLFWTRAQPFYNEDKLKLVQPVKNITHVFHGHTHVKQFQTIANRSFLDLGSYKTGKIGFIEVENFLEQV
jgi:serine/threonine protein phosphatase 1